MPLAFLLRGAHHALHDIFFCAGTIAMPSGYSQSTNAYIKSDRRLNPATDTNLLLAVYGGGSHLTSDIFCLQFLHFQTSDFEVI